MALSNFENCFRSFRCRVCHTNTLVTKFLGIVCVLIVTAFSSNPVWSHPHAWIDLRSTVILNQDGAISGIEQEWIFDNFYTLFVIEDFNITEEGQKEALTTLAKLNLEGLKEYDYFTEVRVGDTKATLGVVQEFESEIRDGRLWMRFVVPLSKPVDASTTQLSFAVYDPSYYVEILHLKDDVVAFRGPSTRECSGHIIPPTPSVEVVLLAQALDQNAEPDNTLGSIFAEQVEVSCQ